MALIRAIYSSRPFGFDEAILNGILLDARSTNRRLGITGALICRADLYLQWLEGPEPQVSDLLARIARDDRHVDMTVHVMVPAADRLFGDWAMLHDPAASWVWTRDEVAAGAIERTTADEVTGFFLQLRSHTVAPTGT